MTSVDFTQLRDKINHQFENANLQHSGFYYDKAGLNIGYGYLITGKDPIKARTALADAGISFSDDAWASIQTAAAFHVTSGPPVDATALNMELDPDQGWGTGFKIYSVAANALTTNYFNTDVDPGLKSDLKNYLGFSDQDIANIPPQVWAGLQEMKYNAHGFISSGVVPGLNDALQDEDWGAAAAALQFNPGIQNDEAGKLLRRDADAALMLGFDPTFNANNTINHMDAADVDNNTLTSYQTKAAAAIANLGRTDSRTTGNIGMMQNEIAYYWDSEEYIDGLFNSYGALDEASFANGYKVVFDQSNSTFVVVIPTSTSVEFDIHDPESGILKTVFVQKDTNGTAISKSSVYSDYESDTGGKYSITATDTINPTNGTVSSTDVSLKYDWGLTYHAGQLGNIFGSQLGQLLGGNNIFAKIGYSTLGGVIAQDLFKTFADVGQSILGASPAHAGVSLLDHILENDWGNISTSGLLGEIKGATAQTLSGILFGEAAEALGLHGFAGQIFTSSASTIAGQLISNATSAGGSVSIGGLVQGIDSAKVAAAAANVAANFIASKITSGYLDINSTGQALFSSVGGSYASITYGVGIGAAIGDALGYTTTELAGTILGTTILPGIGYVVGAVLGQTVGAEVFNLANHLTGGFLGDLFNGLFSSPDYPHYRLYTHYNVGSHQYNLNGQEIYDTSYGSSIVQTINSITGAYLDAINSVVANIGGHSDVSRLLDHNGVEHSVYFDYTNAHYEQSYGVNDVRVALGNSAYAYLGGKTGDPMRLVRIGLEYELGKIDIVNGDPLKTAAFQNWQQTLPASAFPTVTTDGGPIGQYNITSLTGNTLPTLMSNLQIAEDYNLYLQHVDEINSLIAAEPDSAFAAGWLSTLLAVEGIGLNKVYHIVGSYDRDIINTADRDDLIYGGHGDDGIQSFDGNDYVYGGEGNDIIYGGNGDDVLYGDEGSDDLYGGNGNDTLYGGTDNNLVYGDGGNDTIVLGGGNDTIDGGDGINTLVAKSGTGAVQFVLTTGTYLNADGSFGYLSNIQYLTGADGGDYLIGDDRDNSIVGNGGNDYIVGNGGNDGLYGGDGNDTICGSNGSDLIQGGYGDDVIIVSSGIDTIDGGYGTDVLQAADGVAVQFVLTTDTYLNNDGSSGYITNVENLTGADLGDYLAGDSNNNVITGGGGNDYLIGGGGHDAIYGGDGNDFIVMGASEFDTIDGGAGTDTLQATNGISVQFVLTTGSYLNSDGASGYISNVENLTGANGSDYLAGDANNNVITGGGGDDYLIGNGGNDTYKVTSDNQSTRVFNGIAAQSGPTGELDLSFTHDQLWFSQQGSDLVINIMGAGRQTIVKDWYTGGATNWHQLQTITANDNLRIDSSIQNLVQAMATFSAANPAFDPTLASHTTLSDPYFNGALATAVANSWH